MKLASLRLTLRANHRVDVGKFQQITQLGCIDDEGRMDHDRFTVGVVRQRYRFDVIAIGFSRDRSMVQ